MSELSFQTIVDRLDHYIGPIDGDSARGRKRLHILRTATELFARQGYRKTSVDEVAQRAGVAKGTIYTYYPGKIDLLIAAVALEKREHLGAMAQVFDASRAPADRLRDWLVGMLVLPSRMPLTSALVRGDQEMAAVMAELPEELVAQGQADRNDYLGGMIGEVIHPHRLSPSELRDRADVLAGLAYLSTHLAAEHVRGGVSIERYAELLADMIVDGLRGTPQGPQSPESKG